MCESRFDREAGSGDEAVALEPDTGGSGEALCRRGS